MPHFPQAKTKARSPRVRVPNQEKMRFNIDGRLVSAVLRKISLTGGLAEFSAPLDENSIAEALIETASGQVRGLVEFLRSQKKLGPHTYAFRFIALSDADYKRLNATLALMRKLGLSEG
jgi:hypothetical protein